MLRVAFPGDAHRTLTHSRVVAGAPGIQHFIAVSRVGVQEGSLVTYLETGSHFIQFVKCFIGLVAGGLVYTEVCEPKARWY